MTCNAFPNYYNRRRNLTFSPDRLLLRRPRFPAGQRHGLCSSIWPISIGLGPGVLLEFRRGKVDDRASGVALVAEVDHRAFDTVEALADGGLG